MPRITSLTVSEISRENRALSILIDRCNHGDRSAWNEFYSRYRVMIACSLSKHAQTAQDEIEDMVQDVFVELMGALKSYDPSRPIEAYIFEIARRVRISRYRKIAALKRGGPQAQHVSINPHDAYDEDGAIAIPNPHDDQETSLRKAQESRMLRHALRSISSKCQQVLGMRYDQSLSYKEIAAHIDVKEGTLRVIVQRCLAKLSEAYSLLELKEVKET